jgi:hypothetical protein
MLGLVESHRHHAPKLDLSGYFPKHGLQTHFTQRSLRDGAFGEECRTPGHGETLNDSNKLLVIDSEQCPLVIGDADTRGRGAL